MFNIPIRENCFFFVRFYVPFNKKYTSALRIVSLRSKLIHTQIIHKCPKRVGIVYTNSIRMHCIHAVFKNRAIWLYYYCKQIEWFSRVLFAWLFTILFVSMHFLYLYIWLNGKQVTCTIFNIFIVSSPPAIDSPTISLPTAIRIMNEWIVACVCVRFMEHRHTTQTVYRATFSTLNFQNAFGLYNKSMNDSHLCKQVQYVCVYI